MIVLSSNSARNLYVQVFYRLRQMSLVLLKAEQANLFFNNTAQHQHQEQHSLLNMTSEQHQALNLTPIPLVSKNSELVTPHTRTFYFTIGFGLAGLTLIANLALSGLGLYRSFRHYADLMYTLAMHIGLVGTLQSLHVISGNTLLQARMIDLSDSFWIMQCKAFLFTKHFLPAIFLFLLLSFTIAYSTQKFSLARVRRRRTRSHCSVLFFHALPWLLTSSALIPVLIQHKNSIIETLRQQQRCVIEGGWTWLLVLMILIMLPLILLLLLSCWLMLSKSHFLADWQYHHSVLEEQNDTTCLNQCPPIRTLQEFRICGRLFTCINMLALLTQTPSIIVLFYQFIVTNQGFNGHEKIINTAIDVFQWLELSFYSVCAVFLCTILMQLDQAFSRSIETSRHHEGGGSDANNENHFRKNPQEKLCTDFMLTSV